MDHLSHIQSLNKLWHKLIKLTKYKQIEQQFEKFKELSSLEIGIINRISRNPDIIFREICEAYSLPKSTLTNVIDRLEKRGYLKRIISQRDRRSYSLELTEKGALVQKEHLEYENELLGKVINALNTEEEKQMLLNLFGKIIENLEK
ncbi:MAG: MarR family winged helix-turn-helix transcriptional regulator [Ruminiclostridium sp.]